MPRPNPHRRNLKRAARLTAGAIAIGTIIGAGARNPRSNSEPIQRPVQTHPGRQIRIPKPIDPNAPRKAPVPRFEEQSPNRTEPLSPSLARTGYSSRTLGKRRRLVRRTQRR